MGQYYNNGTFINKKRANVAALLRLSTLDVRFKIII